MEARESLREVENLRFRFQMNNRLRLECLAAVSKVFREFEEPLRDELLSAIVFALPQELMSSNGVGFAIVEGVAALPPQGPGKVDLPPEGIPPQAPENPEPDEKPALPPESPMQPGLPPEHVASGYVT
jgi:hypothetical protein